MHARKQTAASRSLHNNRDGSAQTEKNKQANRQLCRAATGLHTIITSSRTRSEMSWLTNRKETKPDVAAINHLCHALHMLGCRSKYGTKPIQITMKGPTEIKSH